MACMIVKATSKNMEVAAAVVAAAAPILAEAVVAVVSALMSILSPAVPPPSEVFALEPGTFSVALHQLPRRAQPVLRMAAVKVA